MSIQKQDTLFLNLLFLIVFTAFFPFSAQAQDVENHDILPTKSVAETSELTEDADITHPPVRLTPDRSEIIRLDGKAGSVIIGNPAHLNILAENARTLILVPREPGATFFTVLDDNGALLMQRHAIVASPKEKYVRIRRSCAAADGDECQNTQVYYCPDMCHEINVVGGETEESPSLGELLIEEMTGGAAGQDGDADEGEGESE